MYYVEGKTKLKEDLEVLARSKLKELGDFPTYITPALKERIRELQEDFLEARQSKKFTEEKGISILREIDDINKSLAAIPRTAMTEEVEARKRKLTKPAKKRKIVKHKK